jgi:hypothetical protein
MYRTRAVKVTKQNYRASSRLWASWQRGALQQKIDLTMSLKV